MKAFHCTQCGECCRNFSDERMVLLFPGELAMLAEGVGCAENVLTETRTVPVEAFAAMGIAARRLRHVDGRCTFLTDDGLCGIHAFKPLQCRNGPDRFMTRWMTSYACMEGIDSSDATRESLEVDLFRLFLPPSQ